MNSKWVFYWTRKRANLQAAVNQLRTYDSARIDISDITTVTHRKEINGGCWLKMTAHESRPYPSDNIGAKELANALEKMLKDDESIVAEAEFDKANQRRWLKLSREVFPIGRSKWEYYWTGKRADLQVAVNQFRTCGSAHIDISDITTISNRERVSKNNTWITIIAHEKRIGGGGNIGAQKFADILEPMLKNGESIRAKVEFDEVNQKRRLKLESA